MAFEYGYGALEDQMIALFCSGAPDFTDSRQQCLKWIPAQN